MLDVYIGFMDEEVASVLNCIVERAIAEDRPLLVFERGQVDNLLFERHLSSYGYEFSKVVVNGPPVSEDDGAKIFADSIQMNFNSELFKKFQHRTHNFVKQKILLNRPGIASDQPIFLFSVMGLNTVKSNSKDAIVVIRSPEMGFQPDLTRTYLRAAIRSLQNLPGAQKGANFNVFGAGGAIGAADMPGRVHLIEGSLFVGSGIVKNSTNPQTTYQGMVRFIGVKQGDSNSDRQFIDVSYFESGPLKSKVQAERQAKSAFALLCGNRGLADKLLEDDGALNQIETKLDKATIKAIPEPNVAKTSLTASFFIGPRIKALARRLNLHDANMEDYHILKILKSVHEKGPKYGDIHLEDVRMIRVDCDPPEIKEETVTSFGQWLASARYSPEKYVAAIKWGLYGAQLPAKNCGSKTKRGRTANKEIAELVKLLGWDWANQRIGELNEEKMLFYEYHEKRLNVILDPFCVEIATDFLKELESGRAFDLGHRKIPDATIDDLQSHLKTLRRMHANSPGDWLPPFVDELIEKLVNRFLNLKYFGDTQNPEKFIIWVRPGSWNGNESVLSTELKVDEATLDRAFYKSANQAALQTHAHRMINDPPQGKKA